ncbi:stage II sporulation protein M [Desulfitobacterium chlororespirans]|uniref:Stage II sporulation protein M n=1 Tax=Desulfitobacterium chlororespirans DSM 11544 TaxID=1121395 RepID=A0A1M7U603_9FIRM|nr:stage II sporulation protein M [Desulfitobacterium chlororespirans]SHN78327.1 stage II sporulation protein M [Desulfitobacterium chlororespirans DSM 11544]
MRKLSEHIRQYWVIYLALVSVYLAGVIFGAVGVGALNTGETQELSGFLDKLLASQPTTLDTNFLIQLAREQFIIMAGIWLLGLTVIGTPLIFLIVFTRGFVFGFTLSFIIGMKGLWGLGLVLISILIPALAGIPFLLLGAGLATIFSMMLLKGKQVGESLRREFMYYSVATILVSLGAVFIGVSQGYFSILGVRFFNL